MNLILASSGGFLAGGILVTIFLLFILFIVLIGIAARYKKCPSDQVLVIFGKTKGDKAARCIHGGAAFIWPVIQDYGFLSLRPLQIEVNLTNALCMQNIRINVPSVFTVGVSTDNSLMGNAANRLLGISQEEIADLAKDIIFGQLRLVIASMTIEQINADRETFLRNIEQNVAEELNKLGLQLLNVNITDITDEVARTQELEHLANRDELTGTHNRRSFFKWLRERQKEYVDGGDDFAVIMMDLDDFKEINDNHGHEVGDRVLVEFTRRVKASRDHGEHLFRLGGDEFVTIKEHATAENAQECLERTRAAIEKMMEINGIELNLGVSMGVALYSDSLDTDILMRQADVSMYANKKARKVNR